VIVADTGAIVALLDRSDQHHQRLRKLFEDAPDRWLLPSAILPEVDYVAATTLGTKVQDAFLSDLADGLYQVEFGEPEDLRAAHRLHTRYRALAFGLVDACVMAIAERLKAEAIATLDLRHFGAVKLRGAPKLFPRDL
jgi:predicted nucleic acid-binding protein